MTASEIELAEVLAKLSSNPGDPEYAQYADRLRSSGDHWSALKITLTGLNQNPDLHRGRLVLARIYYNLGLLHFAVRELEYLRAALPENASIRRLLEQLAPDRTSATEAENSPAGPSHSGSQQISSQTEAQQRAVPANSSVTLAEDEFDIDILSEVDK